MNQQSFNSQLPGIRQTCPKCGYIRETAETKCSDCGRRLQKVSTIRALGIFLVLLGTSLLGIIGWLSFWIYGIIANPSALGGRFNGTPKDMLFIIFVFGLVISISLAAMTGGIWQIIFGKRNKLIVFAVFVLGVIFAVTGLAVAVNK